MCMYYWVLNKITIKNQYTLPFISWFLDQLVQSKIHTKIDLCGAYELICIKEVDKLKIVIRTMYVHFEYNVMDFGFIKALVIFQHLIKDVFEKISSPWFFQTAVWLWEPLRRGVTFKQHFESGRRWRRDEYVLSRGRERTMKSFMHPWGGCG